MQAGFAKECVTPPPGMAMEGLGQAGGIESIHDDLYVRALALAHADERVLIIGCDLLFFEHDDISRIKNAIVGKIGLPPERILLNVSHNHAGPRLTHWAYSDGADPGYLANVETAFVRAAIAAQAAPREVTLWAGETRTDLPVSRRKPEANGQVLWKPYRKGIVCDAVPFCLLKDKANKVVALLFSVSCHPSMIYFTHITAEYPGAIAQLLNVHFNTDGALFLQGAGGDAKPRYVAVEEDHWRHGTWEELKAAGAEVASAIIAESERDLRQVQPDLRNYFRETIWPLDPIPPRTHYEAIAADKGVRRERRIWAREMLHTMDRMAGLQRYAEIALHAIQIGSGVRLVGLAGELVGELGNLIRRVYSQGITFPLGYTDGCELYLPSDRMLPEHGYEVDSFWEYHYPAPLAPGIDARLEAALAEAQARGIMNEPID